MEKWQQEWERTGVVNLPTNKQPNDCKGFILLMCKESPQTFYSYGIVILDDNLQPKEFLGCFENIHFSTKQKDIKEKESVEGVIISWSEKQKIWEAEIYDGYRE